MARSLATTRHWFMTALLEAGWAPAAVFALHLLASRVFLLYSTFPPLDIGMHVLGGAAIAFLAWRASYLASNANAIGTLNRAGLVVIVIGLTCAAAVLWEFAEFLSDRYLGTHAQGSLDDTLSDMLFGILGGAAFAAVAGLRRSQAQLPAPSDEPRR